jgi:tRNA-(ms[2]io[6]A)-hydroxylase
MSQLYVDVKQPTDPKWIDVVFSDFETFLKDHANCERKAAAMAMGFVAKYPDRDKIIEGLIELAREELQHFNVRCCWSVCSTFAPHQKW